MGSRRWSNFFCRGVEGLVPVALLFGLAFDPLPLLRLVVPEPAVVDIVDVLVLVNGFVFWLALL